MALLEPSGAGDCVFLRNNKRRRGTFAAAAASQPAAKGGWRFLNVYSCVVVVGLIAGFLASKVVNKSGEGLILDILLGVVGAVVGGFLFNQFGHSGATGINLYSILVAFVGSVLVLLVYHMVFRRRAI